MSKFVIMSLAIAGLTLIQSLPAHGGQYRGPIDTVPPGPHSGGGGRQPGPTGPHTPSGSGSNTSGPSNPSTPSGGTAAGMPGSSFASGSRNPTTGRGLSVGVDLTKWQFWWEFNKDPFINLKAAIHDDRPVTDSDDHYMGAGRIPRGVDTMKPTEQVIVTQILPKLKEALDRTSNRDITSSCIIAMAKIGKDHPDFKILEVFKQYLTSRDQEVRETAAISMGISQLSDAIDDLVALASDSPRGRALVDRSEVDDRSRSFAAYGLGLVANASSNFEIKDAAFKALKMIIEDEDIANRNPKVAALNGIRLLNPELSDENSKKLLTDCLDTLEKYYIKDLGSGEQQLQAHVPPAVARLLQGIEGEQFASRRDHFKQMFLDQIAGRSRLRHSQNAITQSCALALGQMTEPFDDKSVKSLDNEISITLFDYFTRGKDKQAQYYSLLALGQIGGAENRSVLLRALETGNKATEKPWAAIALGVYAFDQAESNPGSEPDAVIGRAMQSWFGKLKNPDVRAALAVSLGLAKYTAAADDLREMLAKEKHKDELAGYLCIGLALMNDPLAIGPITNIVKTSERRPERLNQAAIALGKLGDKGVTTMLQDMMIHGSQSLAKMSAIASALGFIGDRRTIGPLTKMLFNESLTDLSRAFAAVALGGVADKELLPWNSKIAVNLNYRAAVETLTNGYSGVLDIL